MKTESRVQFPLGRQAVLYAPEGEWKILEPGAMSMEFLRNQIKDTMKELREIGKQPLTADSGNLTVVTTAFAAKKGNSAVQAWAINLAFALERAFHMTALWMNKTDDTKIDVKVDTDFDVGFGDDQSFEYVLNLRERGEISREATLTEAIRRGILNADFDPEADDELLLDDLVDEPGVDDVDDTNDVDDETAEAET